MFNILETYNYIKTICNRVLFVIDIDLHETVYLRFDTLFNDTTNIL